MSHADDIATLRSRLAERQRALAALLAQPVPADSARVQQIAEMRAQIADLVAALRAQGEAVDEAAAETSAPRTITTAGGAYAEGDLHQQGVFVQGGTIQAPVIGVQQGGTIVIQSPQPTLSAQEQRARAQMLAKVRATWLPLLDETLQDIVRMDLGLAANAALVDGPRKRLRQPGRAERPLPPGTPIHAVFDDLAGELLILGAPGSGKTTLLLELARELLDRADRDPAHPIPVIFNLSTWTAQHLSIRAWLVDELSRRYDVPHKIGQAWGKAGALMPLLDGLDEVTADQRADCVAAINAYHAAHGPLRLVVCSRSEEYAALMVQLQLQGAVVIQPLSMDQIDAALAQAGNRLDGVRLAIRDDVVLQELIETPLLLSIMILIYQGQDGQALAVFDTLDARRAHMFAAYVAWMFERRSEDTRYPQAVTLHCLAWLARGMVQNSQTVFYIEQLQPDWLPPSQRWAPTWGVAVLGGLIGGLVGELGGGLVFRLIGGLAVERIGKPVGELGGGLVGGLLSGLAVYSQEITSIETLRWSGSRENIAGGLVGGPVFGLVFGLAVGLAVGPVFGLVFGLLFGLGGGFFGWLVFGLSGAEIPLKAVPNQGIRRSARNALVVGLLFGLFFGLLSGIVFTIVFGSDVGLVCGLVCGLGVEIGVGLLYGGRACLQHLVLRILLWRNGSAPWNYARFLDYAADRILLRKVGGGYIFIHRMLMEYFAALAPEGTTHDPQRALPHRRVL